MADLTPDQLTCPVCDSPDDILITVDDVPGPDGWEELPYLNEEELEEAAETLRMFIDDGSFVSIKCTRCGHDLRFNE